MEIILTNDVDKLGKKNQVVKVKAGFGRNFLIPRGLALIANESNKKMLAEKIKQDEVKMQRVMVEVQKIADTLKSSVIKVGAKVGTSEKIFGAVTAVQLSEAIKKQKEIEIDRKDILLTDEVKTLGTYKAEIRLIGGVNVQVTFEVISE